MNDEMKKCSSCSIEKPRTDFYKKNSSKDLLQSCCKVCSTQKTMKRYYQKREEELLTVPVLKNELELLRLEVERLKMMIPNASPEQRNIVMLVKNH